jgi:hypothetical protein
MWGGDVAHRHWCLDALQTLERGHYEHRLPLDPEDYLVL